MFEQPQHSSSLTPSLSDNSISGMTNNSMLNSQTLEEYCWYWGAASKEEISAAMEVKNFKFYLVYILYLTEPTKWYLCCTRCFNKRAIYFNFAY